MIYVTYDLEQTQDPFRKRTVRSAKETPLPGTLVGWEVGEFELPSGAIRPAVKISYDDPNIGPATLFVEIPANASNVKVHPEKLPEEYRSELDHAA